MKKYVFSVVLLFSVSWAGWHTTEEFRAEAKRSAPLHPYASACVGICDEGSVAGSGILVRRNVVVTASHVLGAKSHGIMSDDKEKKEPFSAEKPFSLMDGHAHCVWLGGVDAASKGRLDDFHTVPVAQIFFNAEADVAFLVLSEDVPEQFVPAPLIPKDRYGPLVRKPFRFLRGTAVSGSFEGGLSVSYVGCGGTVVVPEGITKEVAERAHKGAVDAQDAFTMGTLQLSQRFSSGDAPGGVDTLWGWMSLGDKTKAWSSVLPGDSGAPVFIDIDGTPHILGIVSASAVSDKHQSIVVGTKICAFTGPVGMTSETWWQAFNRVHGARAT